MGLNRMPPDCGPLVSNGIPRSTAVPERTACAPRMRLAAVMKLTVPSSSSGPHRRQFLSLVPSSLNPVMSASRHASPDLGQRRAGGGGEQARVVGDRGEPHAPLDPGDAGGGVGLVHAEDDAAVLA